MSKSMQSSPNNPQTSLPDQHTHSLWTHQQLVYKKPPALLLEPVQEPMNQASSSVVSRAEATVEEVSMEKMTLRVARTKRKSSELHDSESSDETSDLYTVPKISPRQLARKISSLKKTMNKLVKLIDVKFQAVGSKGGQATDRCLCHAFNIHARNRDPPLLESCIQVLFQTEPTLLQLSLRPLLQYLMLRAIFTACGRAGDHQKDTTTQPQGE